LQINFRPVFGFEPRISKKYKKEKTIMPIGGRDAIGSK